MADFLSNPNNVAAILGVASFFVVVTAWAGLMEDRSAERRLKMLERRRTDLRSALMARDRAKEAAQLAKNMVERLNLAEEKTQKGTTADLQKAGFRSKDAFYVYTAIRAVLPFIGWALGYFAFYVLHLWDSAPNNLLMGTIMVGVAMGLMPSMVLDKMKNKRMAALNKSLPDALDLFVICAEAGLSLDATFERVANELSEAHPDLADEFGLTAVELGFMPDRARALQSFSNRCPIEGVRSLVSTLIQTERYGTPLAVAMRVLSAELRNERMMRAEEKAARLPATMTVPMMLFILPCLFIVLMGPAVMRMSDAFGSK